MILRSILVPGMICPKPRPRPADPSPGVTRLVKTAKSRPTLSYPGFQILATCKQLHSEGAPLFYASNDFYLPGGPVALTASYFRLLSPTHSSLIRRMVIRFSVKDFDTPAIDRRVNSAFHLHHLLHNGATLGWTFRTFWRDKIDWMCSWHVNQITAGKPGLSEGRLENLHGNKVVVLSGEQMSYVAEHIKNEGWLDLVYGGCSLRDKIDDLISCSLGDIQRLVQRVDFYRRDRALGTRQWLELVIKEEDAEALEKRKGRHKRRKKTILKLSAYDNYSL